MVAKKTYKSSAKSGRKALSKFSYPKASGNLVKDVARLKKQVKKSRPEVKTTDMTTSSMLVGQCNVNNTGANCFVIPMAIGTGAANGGRIGNEVRLIGNYLRLQFKQQSAAAVKTTFSVEVWKTDDVNLTAGSAGTFLPIVYNADTMSGVIDINSSQNLQYRKIYKKVFSRKVVVPADQTSSVNTIKNMKVLIKSRSLLQWPDTTGSSPNNITFFVVIRADTGNASTTTASTLPLVGQTAANTGCQVFYACKSYYTDV